MSNDISTFSPLFAPASHEISPISSQNLTLETLFQRMQGYEHQLGQVQQLLNQLQAAHSEIARLKAYSEDLEKNCALPMSRHKLLPTPQVT